jgi:hypothetical protein
MWHSIFPPIIRRKVAFNVFVFLYICRTSCSTGPRGWQTRRRGDRRIEEGTHNIPNAGHGIKLNPPQVAKVFLPCFLFYSFMLYMTSNIARSAP